MSINTIFALWSKIADLCQLSPRSHHQKYCVGIVQLVPETSVSEEIVDIFHNYNMIIHVISLPTMGFWLPMKGIWYEWNAGSSSFPLPPPPQRLLLLMSKPFQLNLRYLGQRKYRSGKMCWMTSPWPWPKVTAVALIDKNMLLCKMKWQPHQPITTSHAYYLIRFRRNSIRNFFLANLF